MPVPTSDKTNIVAAIPCLNTGAYIFGLVREAGRYVTSVVVIDDGSSDGTAGLAEKAGAIVFRHPENRGYGGSIKSCFEAASRLEADVLVILDGDGQHSPGEIPRLVAPILAGQADMVIGSRFCGGKPTIPGYRRFGIRAINLLFNFGCRVRVTDSQSGFRAYSRAVYKGLRLSEKGMSVSIETLELARRKGARVAEVPITCYYGHQNINLKAIRHGLGVAASVVRIRLRACFQGVG